MIVKTLWSLPPQKDCNGYVDKGYHWMLMQCDFCGKEFESSNECRKYCCESCMEKAGIQKRKDRKAQARKRKCQLCGETFIPPRNDAKYCSAKCKQSAYRKRKNVIHAEKVKCPFILKVGNLHNKLLSNLEKYYVDGYCFVDVVEAVPSKINETCLIVRNTKEQLCTWNEPFSEPFDFSQRFTQLCPASLVHQCSLIISDYEMKIGKSVTMDAKLKINDL